MSNQLIRTSITLPRDLKRQARVKAVMEETNLSEVIRTLLTQWLEKERTLSPEAEDDR